MTAQQDNRMAPRRWWLMTLALALTIGAFCLFARSWTPLRAGWPILGIVFALAVIRQGADIYEHRQGRRQTPHA